MFDTGGRVVFEGWVELEERHVGGLVLGDGFVKWRVSVFELIGDLYVVCGFAERRNTSWEGSGRVVVMVLFDSKRGVVSAGPHDHWDCLAAFTVVNILSETYEQTVKEIRDMVSDPHS